MSYTKYKPVIYKDGTFYKVKPYIIRITNLGQVPQEAFASNDREPYLTNKKDYFITTNSKTTTNTSNEDYILYEMIAYQSYIYKISSGDTPTTGGFITSDNYILVTANNEYFVSAGG
jgi:hypothetical protein